MADESPIDARLAEIAAGQEKPGTEGAFWRLMAVCDTQCVERWLIRERIVGTTPDTLVDVIALFVATSVYLTASKVSRPQMRAMARDILSKAAMDVENNLKELVDRKKQTVIHNAGIHVVPPTKGP